MVRARVPGGSGWGAGGTEGAAVGERSRRMWASAGPGRSEVGIGRARALPREGSEPSACNRSGAPAREAGRAARGVGALTNPFFSEQCDFTEDQTAGRRARTPS